LTVLGGILADFHQSTKYFFHNIDIPLSFIVYLEIDKFICWFECFNFIFYIYNVIVTEQNNGKMD